jgi:hypothetical protein
VKRVGADGHSIERATQRDEQAIKDWYEKRRPAIKKKPKRKNALSTGRDESGFYLLPMAVRTWAPRGQAPVLRVPLTRDHLIFDQWHHSRWAAVSASASGILQCGGGGRLLARPLRKTSGKLLLIWDGSPIHRGHEVKDFRQQRCPKRLHLEHLPGYVPDLNPDEGIWNYREASSSWAMSAVLCLNHLSVALIRERERLRHKREIIRSCSRQCGYLA